MRKGGSIDPHSPIQGKAVLKEETLGSRLKLQLLFQTRYLFNYIYFLTQLKLTFPELPNLFIRDSLVTLFSLHPRTTRAITYNRPVESRLER